MAAKGACSDTYARARRSHEMALQGELVLAFLAPRTFDYSLAGDLLHVSLFDAVGHDLAAGLVASVAMASCRSTRRAGGSLPDAVTNADQAITGHFGRDRFATALLCELDLSSGQFRWIPGGRPGDRLLLYTDGVTEGRSATGTPFGIRRLAEFVIGQGSAGTPAPKALRLLNNQVLEHQRGRLSDDATVVVVEWRPGESVAMLSP